MRAKFAAHAVSTPVDGAQAAASTRCFGSTIAITPRSRPRRLAALHELPRNFYRVVLAYEKRIARLEGKKDGSKGLSRVVLEDGSSLEREGLFYGPPQRQRSPLAEDLGCEVVSGPAAEVVKADPMTGETSVAGVYVAGDAGSPLQAVALAVASGFNAAFLNQALSDEDADAETSLSSGNEGVAGGVANGKVSGEAV
jgi:thioredoxin reductase